MSGTRGAPQGRRSARASGARLIVALDFTTSSQALAMARRLRGLVRTVKVGSALFTASGPAIVRRLSRLGYDVMLDLKFFDIPNTVELSCHAAAALGAALVTVHAAGGPEMLAAASRGLRTGARKHRKAPPKLLAVTVLTSTADGPDGSARARVLQLARAAMHNGCEGVVASAQEAGALRRELGRRPLIVCPGIRPAAGKVSEGSSSPDDQRRVMTPHQAIEEGADYLVVGRPITAASDPLGAARACVREMEG